MLACQRIKEQIFLYYRWAVNGWQWVIILICLRRLNTLLAYSEESELHKLHNWRLNLKTISNFFFLDRKRHNVFILWHDFIYNWWVAYLRSTESSRNTAGKTQNSIINQLCEKLYSRTVSTFFLGGGWGAMIFGNKCMSTNNIILYFQMPCFCNDQAPR